MKDFLKELGKWLLQARGLKAKTGIGAYLLVFEGVRIKFDDVDCHQNRRRQKDALLLHSFASGLKLEETPL